MWNRLISVKPGYFERISYDCFKTSKSLIKILITCGGVWRCEESFRVMIEICNKGPKGVE